MGARTDFGPLSWDEAEGNRRDNPSHSPALPEPSGQGQRTLLPRAESSGTLPTWQPGQGTLSPQEQWQLLADRRDRLRNEVKRGREYLKQVQKDLVESRSLLEAWPTYERHCGKNPLPDLIQSVASKERIVQFLTDWLKRREEKLDVVICQLRMCDNSGEAKASRPQAQPPEPQV